ncbi:MAG: OmpA family protein [Paenirhodobacter sp.]|uniref:OmpA family protein n=1 Tax=Paenirhodobacter sp. TaxID=1965326 RepID=UPI003D12F081
MPSFPRLFALALCLCIAAMARAEGLADVPGAADPPGLPRISGAAIIGYDQSGYDAFAYPTAKVGWDGAEAQVTVEGPHTRLLYVVPDDRAPLEVIRNYQAELTDQGYTPVYDCGGEACGPATPFTKFLYTMKLENSGQVSKMAFSLPRADLRYLVMRQPETGTTVSIYAAFESFDHFPQTADKVLVLLDLVEGKPMQQRMEIVTAAEMAGALGTEGRVKLYGILFDYDSARLKPDSDATLAEIVTLLGEDPALTVFVVGHTDMTGGYDYNLDLSRRRAAAVVTALTGRFGIAASRLEPAGVGPLAPVAENTTEEGRALNRRVELVKR